MFMGDYQCTLMDKTLKHHRKRAFERMTYDNAALAKASSHLTMPNPFAVCFVANK